MSVTYLPAYLFEDLHKYSQATHPRGNFALLRKKKEKKYIKEYKFMKRATFWQRCTRRTFPESSEMYMKYNSMFVRATILIGSKRLSNQLEGFLRTVLLEGWELHYYNDVTVTIRSDCSEQVICVYGHMAAGRSVIDFRPRWISRLIPIGLNPSDIRAATHRHSRIATPSCPHLQRGGDVFDWVPRASCAWLDFKYRLQRAIVRTAWQFDSAKSSLRTLILFLRPTTPLARHRIVTFHQFTAAQLNRQLNDFQSALIPTSAKSEKSWQSPSEVQMYIRPANRDAAKRNNYLGFPHFCSHEYLLSNVSFPLPFENNSAAFLRFSF